jgi:hypothetical protein
MRALSLLLVLAIVAAVAGQIFWGDSIIWGS